MVLRVGHYRKRVNAKLILSRYRRRYAQYSPCSRETCNADIADHRVAFSKSKRIVWVFQLEVWSGVDQRRIVVIR